MEEKNEKNIITTNQNMMIHNKIMDKNKISNFSELTKEEIEHIKKIREETMLRTERYSELINEPTSSDIFFRDNSKIKKNKLISLNNKHEHIYIDDFQIEDKNIKLDPNKERIFSNSQPFLFYEGEPLIIIGPDSYYYVFLLSIVSFLSIIIYSLKDASILLKVIFISAYLFFVIIYTLLLLINPGIPSQKTSEQISNNQNKFYQCSKCNCISYEEDGKVLIHCPKCNICIEFFDHHCSFATKCIGKRNILLFRIWIYSGGILLIVSFLYLIL